MARKKVEEPRENVSSALSALCEDKGLPVSIVVDAMTEALKKAYFKFSGDYEDSIIRVDISTETGEIKMAKIKNVVEDIQDDVFETDPEEAFEETGVKYNVGDVMETPIDISGFRRAAAMQVKSIFKQKLREAEKQIVVEKFQDKIGDVIAGVVEAVQEQHCIVKIGGQTNAYLNKSSMIPGETLKVGSLVKVYVEEIDKTAIGTPIIVSRNNPRFVTKLMELEIPEISQGIVEIKGISRQPGSRSKVSVATKQPDIDPSGACIGQHGSRIARVLTHLGNEKIDVVNYNDNPLLYVADSLKPAVVVGVQLLNEEDKACRAIVNDDQYSLAIGKEAQNVNLAVRLTGWKIDIKSLSEAEENGYEYQTVEDIKFMEEAKKAASKAAARKVETKPVETKTVEDKAVETPVAPVVKEEVKVVETPTPTRKTKIDGAAAFSALEASLNQTTTTQETKPTKKKYKKYNEDEEFIEDTPKVETKKPVTPSQALPVYSEEEIKAMQEAEEAEEAAKYDDEVDYDEYEDYYEDEDR